MYGNHGMQHLWYEFNALFENDKGQIYRNVQWIHFTTTQICKGKSEF